MFRKPRYLPLRSVCTALMPLLFVSGCATQEALTEQTDPLRQHTAQLDTSLQTTAATARSAQELALANQAREAALSRQLESLLAEFKALQDLQASQAERLRETERSLGELSAVTTYAHQRTDGNTAQVATLAERVTQAERRMDALSSQVREALAASQQDYIRLHGKVVHTVKLTEDKTLYPINSPELGSGDRAKLDALAGRLKGMQDDYHLDIQGHTDNLGTDDNNYALGMARAGVVKRYLHEQGGIPLSRMSVISYGATNPLTASSQGNRRIVLNLLVLEK